MWVFKFEDKTGEMKNFVNLLVTCVVTVVSISQAYTTEALADQVTNLPGAEHLDISFNQFSGYLQIPGSANTYKYIHYWFVESTKSPTTDPIAFWTNGGPVRVF
jgi:carboxypeptidase C (cathepsin A)